MNCTNYRAGHPGMNIENQGGQREELAAELRRTRLIAGLSHGEIARQAGLSESSVSRLENGQILPSLDDLDHWSFAVGASKRVREQLRVLAETAATEVMALRPWLRTSVAEIQDDIGRLEASAAAVRSCEPLIVPGLLQTAEYAARIMGSFGHPQAELEAATTARIARQSVMHDTKREFEFILTEYGLRWSPLGTSRAELSAQLDHISELAEVPNVSVGVIRTGVQTRAALLQAFTLYQGVTAEDSQELIDIVLLETPGPVIVVTDPVDVQRFRTHLAWLREAADFGPNAIGRIRGKRR